MAADDRQGAVAPDHRLADLLDECNQLCNILAKSLITAKAGRNPRKR